MNIKELKLGDAKMNPSYRFWFCDTLNMMRREIIKGKFDDFCPADAEAGIFLDGLAHLEFGYVDIELRASAQPKNEDRYTNKIWLSYFCNVKGKVNEFQEDWSPAAYMEDMGRCYAVKVDWASDKWREKLERNMWTRLRRFVTEFDLNVDSPNWIGADHSFDVFDRLCGVEVA